MPPSDPPTSPTESVLPPPEPAGLRVQSVSPSQCSAWVARWLGPLSPNRAHLVGEQIRASIDESKSEDRWRDRTSMMVVSRNGLPPAEPLAAAMLQREADTLTIVHAGSIAAENVRSDQRSMATLARVHLHAAIVDVVTKSSIGFAQWATDPVSTVTNPSDAAELATRMGFQPIATLDYLTADLSSLSLSSSKPLTLAARRVLTDASSPLPQAFTDAVEATYESTADCPGLRQFRTAREIVEGYRRASGFDPAGWFTLHQDDRPVGTLVLATHRGDGSNVAVELVYMGLVPSVRGRGLGRDVLRCVHDWSHRRKATNLVLAVDRANPYASDLYRSIGMRDMLSETVWVVSPDELHRV